MKFTFMTLFLLGCSTPQAGLTGVTRNSPEPVPCTQEAALPSYDPSLQIFVQDFFRDAQKYNATCYRAQSVTFVSQKEIPQTQAEKDTVIIGYCTEDGRVVLSRDVWESSGMLSNKALLFHELGHCVLDLGHAPKPAINIMAPCMLEDDILAENWASLIKKLFTKSMELEEDSDVVFDRHPMQTL